MKAENIMQVANISIADLCTEFIAFLSNELPIYRDLILSEHLYSVSDIAENERHNPHSKEVTETLAAIDRLLRDINCSYFRLLTDNTETR
ncbi:hypothetical protein ACFQZX_00220 [Mucilaginibacter litoreus]|uniref:Uncharacterized protein n=1 Tax=Mucilaginibacter litoreus TaxID=1048221 RepID=A0ABW3AMK0_9SPHI